MPFTLEAFFAEHGKALAGKVKGVCCDMWQPYVDVIKKPLPEATLVFDRFHITPHHLGAVDEVRRQEARELKKTNPERLKRTRYLWLKNVENLTVQGPGAAGPSGRAQPSLVPGPSAEGYVP